MAKKRNLAFDIFADRNIIALQTQPPLFSIKEYVNRLEFVKNWVVKSPKILLIFANIPHIEILLSGKKHNLAFVIFADRNIIAHSGLG